MEKTYNPALIQRTQRYMETHSISQNQFAAKVNLSSAALSSYLNQKYKGSVEAVERQLSEFFKLDEEAEAAAEKTASLLPRAAYVPTSISEDVCQSIRFAQLEHCMVVLHGDAGRRQEQGRTEVPARPSHERGGHQHHTQHGHAERLHQAAGPRPARAGVPQQDGSDDGTAFPP